MEGPNGPLSRRSLWIPAAPGRGEVHGWQTSVDQVGPRFVCRLTLLNYFRSQLWAAGIQRATSASKTSSSKGLARRSSTGR